MNIYVLYQHSGAYQDINDLGIFDSFDQAKAGLNSYLSWTGQQGPFELTKTTDTTWSFEHSEYYKFVIYKKIINKRWWEFND